jgi:hypothetical protein
VNNCAKRVLYIYYKLIYDSLSIYLIKNNFKNQLLERHPFSGRCDSAGELLHTPCADSNFHGPLRIFDTINTFEIFFLKYKYLKKKKKDNILSKGSIRTDLKFERRPRSFKQDPQIPRLIALP